MGDSRVEVGLSPVGPSLTGRWQLEQRERETSRDHMAPARGLPGGGE